ncbi:MAG: DUF4124 domain-containing protein [Deltaproteobacteria bacterium]|nr:DUF4124 domain-containing protein [Deltaproteobacteria bacterium]
MKKLTLILVLTIFSATAALADLYQWQDREGVIHITDSLEKVPDAYRDKVKVYESAPKEKKAETEAVAPAPLPPERGVELYGDHTLEWWRQTFLRKTGEAQMLESNVTAKRQFIDIYERGRGFGQTFGMNEIETYSRYKKELPDDQDRLTTLKNELDDLRREARIAGVPRDIRGE